MITNTSIIFAKHGNSKAYAFRVPEELIPHIKKDMMILVETYKGIDVATTTTGVMSGDGALDVARTAGAYEPLRPVIGLVPKILEACIIRSKLTGWMREYEEYKPGGGIEDVFRDWC